MERCYYGTRNKENNAVSGSINDSGGSKSDITPTQNGRNTASGKKANHVQGCRVSRGIARKKKKSESVIIAIADAGQKSVTRTSVNQRPVSAQIDTHA